MTLRPRIVIIVSLILLALNFAYLPFVPIDRKIYPFPYNEKQYVMITNYVDYICGRFGTIFLFGFLTFYYAYKLREYLFWAGVIYFLWFIDFLMTYNEPYAHYKLFPESYSFWMAIGLVIWLGYDYYLDTKKHG